MLFSLLSVLVGCSQAAQSPLELVKAVEAHYLKAKTLQASFQQEQWVEITGQDKVTEGTLEVKLPGEFRWETLTPDRSLVVSDGKSVWFYTPPFSEGGRGQILKQAVGGHQTVLLQALLAGNLSRIQFTKLRRVACKSCAQGVEALEMIPKKGTAAGVTTARVFVDSKKHEISRVELSYRSGNRSKISLQNLVLGKPFEPGRFRFVAPPDTDVLKE